MIQSVTKVMRVQFINFEKSFKENLCNYMCKYNRLMRIIFKFSSFLHILLHKILFRNIFYK